MYKIRQMIYMCVCKYACICLKETNEIKYSDYIAPLNLQC